MDVGLQARTLRFAAPLRTAFGELRQRELIELTLRGSDGVVGAGEAAPLEPYDGVALSDAREALEAYRPFLQDGDDASGAELLDACRAAADLPQALAAVDVALWDRAARREGRPLCALLTDRCVASVPVNATIGATDRAGAAAAATAAVAAGYRCLKLKVGVGDDAGRVAAVRAAAGPSVALRLDANGAWSVPEAIAAIGALEAAGLELVEEPVHGVEALREVREAVAVRIAIDESSMQPGALGAGVADAVCLKLSRLGGVSAMLVAATLARAGGAEVYVASTFDGPLSIAAALHVAAALEITTPCGLATLELFSEPPPAELAVADGAMAVPRGPGLGVDPA